MATGALVQGGRSTLNIEPSQREVDMADKINLLEPDAQPLCVLTRKLPKKRTISPKFEWLEDELAARFDATTTTHTTGDTAINVTTGTRFHTEDIIQNTRTGENMRVVSVASNAVTVVRAIGSTATAMLSGDEILILGSAAAEGADVKAPWTQNPANVFNYTQIFRTPYKSTGTLLASGLRTNPSDWAYQSNKKGIEHAKGLEYAFIHGRKAEDASVVGAPRRVTGGALQFIQTNQLDAGGTLTEVEFNQASKMGFRYGAKSKLLLASSTVTAVLNTFPMGKLQFRQDDSTYGLNIARFVSPFGNLNLVNHWLLEGTKYSGYALGLDMDEIRYRFLGSDGEERDTKILRDRQNPGEDAKMDEYLTEAGLEFGQEKKHFLLTGVTG
jgi:hypothetical protein